LSGGGDYPVVARDLTLKVELTGDIANARMKEIHRFDQLLDQVGPVVVAADMGQFVDSDLIDFLSRQLSCQLFGKENHGTLQTQGDRRSRMSGDANRDWPARIAARDPGTKAVL